MGKAVRGRRSPITRLDPDAVRAWVEGQEAAGRVIEAERCRWLRGLDRATALRLYLSLVRLPSAGRPLTEPSPLLLAMRDAVARLNALKASEARARPACHKKRGGASGG